MSLSDAVQVMLAIISLGVAVALVVSVIISNRKASEQLTMIAQITIQTHTLVNKRYGEALMAQILLARSVARLTIDPREQEVADQVVFDAELAYEDHQSKQTVLDATQPQIKPGE